MVVSQMAAPSAVRELTGFAAIIAIIMLFAAGKAVLFDTLDPDCFWHLRVAEQLHRDGIGPIVDQISYSTTKTAWSPYSWLGELGMKSIWDHAGLRGAIAVQAILQAAFILLIAMCAMQSMIPRDEPIPLMPAVVATALAAFLSLPYLSFRPVLGAIVVLALCAWILLRDRRLNEQSRLVWIVPFLTALTINLHIFAVFIPIWIGALLAGALVERRPRNIRRYAMLLALCTVACCCTPMLPGTLATIREYMIANPLTSNSMIAELEPMYRGLLHQITLGVIAAIILCALVKNQFRAGEWIWLSGMFVLWIKCGRAAPILVPILVPAIAGVFSDLSDRALAWKWANRVAFAILLIGITRIILSLPNNQEVDAWLNRRGSDLPGYPSAAAEYVDRNVPRTTGKLINEFDWGGYLAWKLPAYQVLLDGRTQLYSPAFWRDAYLNQPNDTTHLLASVEADAAILPAGKSRFRDSLQQLGWKSAYRDVRAEVLVPPASVADSN